MIGSKPLYSYANTRFTRPTFAPRNVQQ